MFRLLLAALVLGAALAKPQRQLTKEPRNAIEPRYSRYGVPARSMPLPLPTQESTKYSLDAGRYFITSPNFFTYYPNNAYVEWTLEGSNGQTISISCSKFSVENHSSCDYDYLSVNDANYCGTSGPDVSASKLDVVFSSDGSVRRRGFYCIITVPEGSGSTTAATTAATESPTDSVSCGIANRASRIVGGVETEANEYPWQGGIVNSGSDRTWCGGTVISSQYVLTAAHCTAGQRASNIQVLLGEHEIGTSDGELRFSVAEIIDHPDYTDASVSGYDFSLLRLSSTIDFASLDNKVAPACLPTGGNFANVDAIVSGWGTTSSGGSQATALREVTVKTMTNDECRQAYPNNINDSMLCASVDEGGKDSCQGDSGGPLVTEVDGQHILIGVVSWGVGCGDEGYPGVYARVTAVSDWISPYIEGTRAH